MYEDTVLPHNVWIHLPADTELCPRRIETSGCSPLQCVAYFITITLFTVKFSWVISHVKWSWYSLFQRLHQWCDYPLYWLHIVCSHCSVLVLARTMCIQWAVTVSCHTQSILLNRPECWLPFVHPTIVVGWSLLAAVCQYHLDGADISL